MKRISVRDFQLKPTKYLQELPLVLTQYNKDVAQLLPMDQKVLTDPPKQLETEKWQGICQAPNQRCREYGKKYSITYNDGEQDVTIEQYLCPNHYLQANSEAEDVEEV